MPKIRWLDIIRDDIKEKGLSGNEVYARATWRRNYQVSVSIISRESLR